MKSNTLKKLNNVISTKNLEYKPVMQNVRFTKEFAEACDGHILVRVKQENTSEQEQFINHLEVKKIVSDSKAFIDGKLNSVGGKVGVQQLEKTTPGGQYPDTDQVYPNSEIKARIKLNPEYLEKLAQIVKSEKGKYNAGIAFEIREETQGVEFYTEDKEITGLLMPMRISNR